MRAIEARAFKGRAFDAALRHGFKPYVSDSTNLTLIIPGDRDTGSRLAALGIQCAYCEGQFYVSGERNFVRLMNA